MCALEGRRAEHVTGDKAATFTCFPNFRLLLSAQLLGQVCFKKKKKNSMGATVFWNKKKLKNWDFIIIEYYNIQ